MKRIFDKTKIEKALSKSCYKSVLTSLDKRIIDDFFIAEYDKGEFVSVPEAKKNLFQIIVSGKVSIYFIRDDGTSYSLASSETDVIIGSTELFNINNSGVFAEAIEKVRCIAFDLEENRSLLMENISFMRMIAESSCKILTTIARQNAAPASLKERVISFITYKCPEKTLKGVEKSAFTLHCSPRQLQRILNEMTEAGITQKTGKGTYRLI